MLLTCTNKGCYAYDEHLLDDSENKAEGGNVYCLECGEVVNVPRTTKATLKSLGQVRRNLKTGPQFLCKSCGAKDKPQLKKLANNTFIALCKSCGKQIDVHPSFIEALKVIGKDDKSGTAGVGPN